MSHTYLLTDKKHTANCTTHTRVKTTVKKESTCTTNEQIFSAEPRSSQFLMQRLSVALQRGNAACVLGTVPSSHGLDDLFYL